MAASSVGHSDAAVPRRRRTLPIVAVCVALLVALLVAGMLVYDSSRKDVIASGVSIGGVNVGGLHAAAARTKLEHELVAHLDEPVVVHVGGRHWTLTASEAGVHVDVSNMVDQAVAASREGSIFTRTFHGIFGGGASKNIAVVVSYNHQAVRKLDGKVRAEVNRAARDASVQPGPEGLKSVASAVGLSVDTATLGRRVESALTGQAPNRSVHVPTHQTKPAITTANLASKYPSYIVVDRSAFKLRFYAHLKLTRTYEIAVGMEGLETPAGLHKIEWEQVEPPWYVPKKAWAGSLAGTVVPPGPGDPLKARFMSFEGGAGIHGIDPSEYSSIGHNASHGCVRMRIPDVIDLYAKSPVGTPVYII
ncbi:MAG TPA: L,D-transpeptidase/peptidoglycan binding protein [Solirubrobacteraceae bacterium]